MSAVAATLGVARSHLAALWRAPGRPPLPEEALLAEIEAIIADMPTYGYARVWARLRRKAVAEGRAPANRKRVYRVVKVHGLLLDRHAGGIERRHDGRIAVARSNLRWCSDGFDNGEKVRVAFALDCCDREAMGDVATTEGCKGEDVCDLMVTPAEHRFGKVNRLPLSIEWLTENGSCFVAAKTRCLARDIRPEPLTTPVQSPQSNGMAEAFVRTFKRDYVSVNSVTDARTVMLALPEWFDHYNEVRLHSAIGNKPPISLVDRPPAPSPR
ncbi:IS2 element protein [Hyphomicrobiales bacterium]|nr:IS2 element protein [Hyphomicrobiales bacterium]CAH1685272.1 IS2 element protein [Hyphomicrobiales bacterium]